MIRSRLSIAALACTLILAFGACGGDDDDDSAGSGGTTGSGGSATPGTGGVTAVGTGGMSGAAGSGATANMPDAMCISRSSGANPACDACACTPNAMKGCLTELTACQGNTDAMAAMMCKSVIDCATKNKCSGMACLTPCMTEITTAYAYMGGAPVTAATAVGDCTTKNCPGICP